MGSQKVPGRIAVSDRSVVELLRTELGVELNAETDGDSMFITRANWMAARASHPLMPMYRELFKAQKTDGDETNLSGEDVRPLLQKMSERSFVREHGEPQAIIKLSSMAIEPQLQRVLEGVEGKAVMMVRTRNGDYHFGYQRKSGAITFTQLQSADEGRRIEMESASARLQELATRFDSAPFEARLALKTTARSPRMASMPQSGEASLSFGDTEYNVGNSNSLVAYHPSAPESRFFLSQDQNGCVAASILNGTIVQGKMRSDPKLRTRFYDKLNKIELEKYGERYGRITWETLFDAANNGVIPGMSAEAVDADEARSLVRSGRPVVASVPYFNGHAILMTGVSEDGTHYTAVDTVSGMIVEEKFEGDVMTEESDAKTSPPIAKADPAALLDGIDIQTLARRLAELQRTNPDLLGRLGTLQQSGSGFLGDLPLAADAPPPRQYFHIEITDPKKFLAWLEK